MINKPQVLIIWVIILFAPQLLLAQENTSSKHEFGIVTLDLSYFGFIYKLKFDEHAKLRISASDFRLSGNSQTQITIGSRTTVGYEKTRALSQRVFMSYGPEFGLSSQQRFDINNDSFQFSLSPSFIYFIGLQYELNEKLYVGGELRPAITTSYRFTNMTVNPPDFGIQFDFGSRVRLHIVYTL